MFISRLCRYTVYKADSSNYSNCPHPQTVKYGSNLMSYVKRKSNKRLLVL